MHSGIPLNVALPRFIFISRITLHSTTGEPLSKLMFGWLRRSKLALVKPSIQRTIRRKQNEWESRGRSSRSLSVGDKVMMTQNRRGEVDWV